MLNKYLLSSYNIEKLKYLEGRFIYFDVGEDLVEKGQLSGPVRICDAVIPHPGAEDQLVGSVLQGPAWDDELSTVHRQRCYCGDILQMRYIKFIAWNCSLFLLDKFYLES